MKKLITILLLIATSITVKAQTWKVISTGTMQRLVSGTDTTYRFVLSGGITPTHLYFNPNGGGGTADSTVFRTKNNSYSLSGMQTKLNNYTLTSRAFTAGYGMLGGGNFTSDKVLYLDSAVARTVSNSLSLSQLQTKFNTKQNSLTLTTTGTSGAATLIGSTLNIPSYATGGSGVSSVTSANGDITVANTTTTPVLTLNSGTGNNQILKRDGSGKIVVGSASIYETISSATDEVTYRAGNTSGTHYFNSGTTTKLLVNSTGVQVSSGNFQIGTSGNLIVQKLSTALTPPTPTGTTKMLIVDNTGLFTYTDLPSSDTTAFRTTANSYSLSGMQTKLNNYVLQSRTLTGGNGINTIGDLSTNRTISADTSILATKANTKTLAQLQTDFNLKQNTITLTTTGTSGAATLVGSTLNIPNYASGSSFWSRLGTNQIQPAKTDDAIFLSSVAVALQATSSGSSQPAASFNSSGGDGITVATSASGSYGINVSNSGGGDLALFKGSSGATRATLKQNGTLLLKGGIAYGYVAVTSTYSATVDDRTINCTSGTFTVTLSTSVAVGQEVVVKNRGAGIITVGGTIDGNTNDSIVAGASGTYVWTGSEYIKV